MQTGAITLNQLCSNFTDSPKSMEQRIRRSAYTGMVNLAHLGLEDYYDETFSTYASIKNFLNSLILSCTDS